MSLFSHAAGVVDTFITFPDFKSHAQRRLDWVESLKDGWHAGNGVAFSTTTILRATRMTGFLETLGITDVNVCPEDDGTLILSWMQGDFFLQLGTRGDKDFMLDVEKDNADYYSPDKLLSLDAVKEKIRELADEGDNQCTLSEKLKYGITTETENLRTLYSSRTPLKMVSVV
jgi:hypothetical protein